MLYLNIECQMEAEKMKHEATGVLGKKRARAETGDTEIDEYKFKRFYP